MNRVSVILNICHYPIYGLISDDSSCWDPLFYEISRSDHKIDMKKIELLHMKFYSCVRHIFVVLNIIFMISSKFLDHPFSALTVIYHTIFTQWFQDFFSNSRAKLMTLFIVEVCITTCLTYTATPSSGTVSIKIERNLLYVAL